MRDEDPAWQPPGGETIAMVRARTEAAFRRVVRAHQHQTVLVVSHGTAINCLVSELLSIPPTHTFRFTVSNCGLTEVAMRRSMAVVTRLNDTSHLDGLETRP